jgi:hypothetical protein
MKAKFTKDGKKVVVGGVNNEKFICCIGSTSISVYLLG